jgi:hypothetical protein
MNLKRNLILLLGCLATQIALGEPSLAEKNAAENAAIKKDERCGARLYGLRWQAKRDTAFASTGRVETSIRLARSKSAVAAGALPAQSMTRV